MELAAGHEELELSSVLAALRRQLKEAAATAVDEDIHFPVKQIQVELQVAVTRSADAKGGVKFLVFDLGAELGRAVQSVQRVTLTLDAPVDPRTLKPLLVLKPDPGKPE